MSQFVSQHLDPKQRENRGIITREVYSEAEYNRALRLRWVFFCKYDKSVFPLYLKRYAWPAGFRFHDKMNITKGTVLPLKTEIGLYDCQFVETCLEKEYDSRSRRTMEILDRAKQNNVSIAELTMSLGLAIF